MAPLVLCIYTEIGYSNPLGDRDNILGLYSAIIQSSNWTLVLCSVLSWHYWFPVWHAFTKSRGWSLRRRSLTEGWCLKISITTISLHWAKQVPLFPHNWPECCSIWFCDRWALKVPSESFFKINCLPSVCVMDCISLESFILLLERAWAVKPCGRALVLCWGASECIIVGLILWTISWCFICLFRPLVPVNENRLCWLWTAPFSLRE